MLPAEGESSPFGLIQGIPVHPLVVHAAVVFVPVAALGLLLMAVWPKFGARYGWVVWGLALVATVSSFVAKESGEQLEDLVGEPGFEHAEWGDRMPLIAGVLFLAALALWFVQRSYVKRENAGKALVVIFGLVAAVVAVFNLYWIVQVGHTGAESVWKGEVSSQGSGSETGDGDEAAGTSAAPTTSTSAAATAYTAAEVAKHSTAADCWTSVNGMVYDVTNWEDQHPGGATRILNLCGTDGSSAFDGQHEGQPKPEDMLATYQIGTLG